jgi:hypothetical protein
MKNKILLIFLIILVISISASAQKTFKLEDYILSNVGDEWQYKNLAPEGLSPIVVNVSEKIDFKGVSTLKRDENNGDYRLQTLDKKGLKIYQLYFTGDSVVEYEQPIRLMPAKLKEGKIYKSESRYNYLVKGGIIDSGMQTYEVKVVGTQDITIGEKTFENCLLLTTKANRTDSSGAKKGYLLREWYAKGIGAVKVTGTIYWDGKGGKRTRTFYIDAEIEKAKVNGLEVRLTK